MCVCRGEELWCGCCAGNWYLNIVYRSCFRLVLNPCFTVQGECTVAACVAWELKPSHSCAIYAKPNVLYCVLVENCYTLPAERIVANMCNFSLCRLSSIFHLLMGVTLWLLPFEIYHGVYKQIFILCCTPFCHGASVILVDDDSALVVHTRIPPVSVFWAGVCLSIGTWLLCHIGKWLSGPRHHNICLESDCVFKWGELSGC
jgi:hypothetical protein